MIAGPVLGRLLRFLVAIVAPRQVLEIGTFSGYSAMAMAGGLPPEGRKFSPHITLARLDRAAPDVIRNWLHENSLVRAAPFAVDEFVLFQSLLGNGGAVYRVVEEYPLGEADDG